MRRFLVVAALLLLYPFVSSAQYVRSAYFMNASTERISLNPAFQPNRGYIAIPVIGSMNLDIDTSLPNLKNIDEILGVEDDFITSDSFFNMLQPDNSIKMNLNTDLISFGFYSGESFLSFNVGARVNANVSVPKSLFELMRDVDDDILYGTHNYSIGNEKISINAYTEIGFGYSYNINEKLTVGGKLKMLLGAARMKLNVNRLDIEGYFPAEDFMYGNTTPYANIATDVEMEFCGKGIALVEDENGYISDLEIGKYGIGGYGAAIDLGIEYNVTDNFALSAAVLDLGCIFWNKDNSTVYSSKENIYVDNLEDVDLLDFEMFGLRNGVNAKVTSKLHTTAVLAAEYSVLNDKIGFGVLATATCNESEFNPKLTGILSLRPWRSVSASVSYTTLGGTNSIGAALKLGSLFVGTDYITCKGNQRANCYLGVTIPLGKKKTE